MCACIFERERSVYERDVVAVEELLGNVRGQIWGCGELRVGGAIDAMERDLTILGIAECATVDAQSHL
jgi:hypothetical protein